MQHNSCTISVYSNQKSVDKFRLHSQTRPDHSETGPLPGSHWAFIRSLQSYGVLYATRQPVGQGFGKALFPLCNWGEDYLFLPLSNMLKSAGSLIWSLVIVYFDWVPLLKRGKSVNLQCDPEQTLSSAGISI